MIQLFRRACEISTFFLTAAAEASGPIHETPENGTTDPTITQQSNPQMLLFTRLGETFSFPFLPWKLERVLLYGVLICLESFTHCLVVVPVRCAFTLLVTLPRHLVWRRIEGRGLSYGTDVVHGLLIGAVTICLWLCPWSDYSRMYHMVRGENVLKLYVLYNVLEVFDRLLCAFGQDVMTGVVLICCSRFGDPSTFGLSTRLFAFAGAVAYSVAHALVMFLQIIALNVALHSQNNGLFALLFANNFMELKGSVFRRAGKENLLQITCSDIVERFHLGLYAAMMFCQNLRASYETQKFGGGGGAGLDQILLLFACEMVTDSVKHAFILRFNNLPVTIYDTIERVLCVDVRRAHLPASVAGPSPSVSTEMQVPCSPITTLAKSDLPSGPGRTPKPSREETVVPLNHVQRRLGMAIIPAVSLTLRFAMQALPDFFVFTPWVRNPAVENPVFMVSLGNFTFSFSDKQLTTLLIGLKVGFAFLILLLVKILLSILIVGHACTPTATARTAKERHMRRTKTTQGPGPTLGSAVGTPFQSPQLSPSHTSLVTQPMELSTVVEREAPIGTGSVANTPMSRTKRQQVARAHLTGHHRTSASSLRGISGVALRRAPSSGDNLAEWGFGDELDEEVLGLMGVSRYQLIGKRIV